VDPDFFSDYPPTPSVAFSVPRGFKVLYAKGIAAVDMPLVLQRAKIVLDLALPGVERLGTHFPCLTIHDEHSFMPYYSSAIEGILFGAIPIISNRWVGSSDVDYAGVHRVDAQNGSHISEVLDRVARDYETELQSLSNAAFFHQTQRMWDRMLRSTDVVIGSSHLHFVLYARSLDEEDKLLLQVLVLLYHYPLCSLDAYVVDVMWFVRHHYGLFKTLQHAGYIRYDPLHPDEHLKWMQPNRQRSFIQLKPISAIAEYTEHSSGDVHDLQSSILLRDSPLVPAWGPLLVLLRSDLALCDWRFLLEQLSDLRNDEVRVLSRGCSWSSSSGGEKISSQMHCNTLGVLAAPSSNVGKVIVLLRFLIESPAIRSQQCEETQIADEDRSITSSDNTSIFELSHRSVDLHFANICSLYENRPAVTLSASATCHRFRSRIQQSTSWFQAVQLLRSTGLNCE